MNHLLVTILDAAGAFAAQCPILCHVLEEERKAHKIQTKPNAGEFHELQTEFINQWLKGID